MLVKVCRKCRCRISSMYPGKFFCKNCGIIWEDKTTDIKEEDVHE